MPFFYLEAVSNRATYSFESRNDANLLDDISGSEYDAFENTPWIVNLTNYIHDVIKNHRQIPLVGICFGHQIIARALGAGVGRNAEGWEISVDTINLSQAGSELFGKGSLVCYSSSFLL